MSRKKWIGALIATATVGGVVYADTVDNPGDIWFVSDTDASVRSSGGGDRIWINHGNELILGTVDSSGATSFAQADITFDPNTDSNDYTALLMPTSSATGTYCPNSGAATITMTARIKITQVQGVPLGAMPCFMTLNGGNPITLTTGTSGTLTGNPIVGTTAGDFVAQVPLGPVTGTCSPSQQIAIKSYYGLVTGTTADIQLFGTFVHPSNLTGNGC